MQLGVEKQKYEWLDSGTKGMTSGINQDMATLETLDRREDCRRQSHIST